VTPLITGQQPKLGLYRCVKSEGQANKASRTSLPLTVLAKSHKSETKWWSPIDDGNFPFSLVGEVDPFRALGALSPPGDVLNTTS
jgi:hypothetical protein